MGYEAMVSRRTFLSAGSVLAAAGATVWFATRGGPANGPGETALGTVEFFPPQQRRDAPQVSGELLDGTHFDLADLHGQVVVLNWWGSWCTPCRAEAGDLREVYEATHDLGVEFLGVDVRDGRDAAQAFHDAFDHAWPSLFDPGGQIAMNFRDVPPTVVPTTMLLDRDHRVAAVFRKRVYRHELEDPVRELAAETER